MSHESTQTSSTEASACCSRVTGPTENMNIITTNTGASTSPPKAWIWLNDSQRSRLPCPATQPNKHHKDANLLFASCGTKRMNIITTNSGASTPLPKLGAGFQSRGVREKLVPRVNPISSRVTPACCYQVADSIESINIITTNCGASTSSPKLGAGFKSRGVRVYLVPRINPISSTRTPA